ncbi:MAG TPA: GGDEF domain-containing protein [Terriglobales bacterium]
MDFWNQAAFKSFLVPGVILLAGTAILLRAEILPPHSSALSFYYYAALGAGLLLAWRFHSTRVLFALLVLCLAARSLSFFSDQSASQGRAALDAISILLPLNFVALSFIKERGFTAGAVGARLLFVFLQSVLVAVLCRPENSTHFLHVALLNAHWFAWTKIPQLGLLAFLLGSGILCGRALLQRKPVESGFAWSLIAAFLAFQFMAGVQPSDGYLGTAALILVFAVVQTSYLMAYHDELTGLPARRAFNSAIAGLTDPYSIAIVDIDHFKQFNDTYGHDIGDEVLRLVASHLAQVTGGGDAFRCGGEEFAIVFPGKSMKDAVIHLELLRTNIEQSRFRVRQPADRRKSPRGSDRRRGAAKKRRRSRSLANRDLSVTVSIGIAEPSTRNRDLDQVIRAADMALYRAKDSGRNRVVMDDAARSARSMRVGAAF